MTRKEANIKIADILMSTEWQQNYNFATSIRNYAKQYPNQRCGQIICNYICPDYRNNVPSSTTVAFIRALFPNNPDPFFEESEVTLKRLKLMFNKKMINYITLDEILTLNINPEIKEEFKNKFDKLVFFDLDGICKTGKLSGLSRDSSMNYYYIIKSNGTSVIIPIYQSITLL